MWPAGGERFRWTACFLAPLHITWHVNITFCQIYGCIRIVVIKYGLYYIQHLATLYNILFIIFDVFKAVLNSYFLDFQSFSNIALL